MNVQVLLVACMAALFLPVSTAGNVLLDQCQISCGQDIRPYTESIETRQGSPGKRGPVGPNGSPGPPGQSCACADVENLQLDLRSVKKQLNELSEKMNEITKHLTMKDCSKLNTKHGHFVADIYPFGSPSKSVKAMCDMTTQQGGWTVIQRRINGSVDFYRGWQEYADGFGDASSEYWLGLEAIYFLTRNGDQMLRVELEDYGGNVGYATYSTFIVGSAATNYKLTVSGYSGNIGDSLNNSVEHNGRTQHNGRMFTAQDRDNDRHDNMNCAVRFHGAWWYDACHRANLNGDYKDRSTSARGVSWWTWKNNYAGVKTTKMMIRPKYY